MLKRTLLFVFWSIFVILFLGSALNSQLAAYRVKDPQNKTSVSVSMELETPIPTDIMPTIMPTVTQRVTPTPTRRIGPTPTPTRSRPIGTATPTRIIITPTPFGSSPTPTPTLGPTPSPTPSMGPNQGMVSGKILNADSPEGFSGALVDVYNGTGFTHRVSSTTTDSEGVFILLLAPGKYKLVVRKTDYLPIPVYTRITQGVITYQPLLEAIPTALQQMGETSGTINNAINRGYISGMQVVFREGINAATGPIVATAITQNGRYVLNLPSGYYTGEVSGGDYISGHFSFVAKGRYPYAGAFSVTPRCLPDQIRIVLNWDSYSLSLNSHIAGYDRERRPFHMSPSGDQSSRLIQFNQNTVTILHKSQLQNAVFAVNSEGGGYGYRGFLPLSGAVVRVYEETGLIGEFHIPANQSGNLWNVFVIDQHGICPINQITNENIETLQVHDLDGDLSPDWVSTGPYQVTTCGAGGGKHMYPINEPLWQIIAYSDMDGQPGEEIIVETYLRTPYHTTIGKRFLIIHERSQTITEFSGDFGESFADCHLALISDLDGKPGNELVLEKMWSSPRQHLIRVASDRNSQYQDYDVTSGLYSSLTFNIAQCVDYDGISGNELVLTHSDSYRNARVAMIHFRDSRVNEYPLTNYSYPVFSGPVETDGAPGYEFMVADYFSRAKMAIIHDRTQSINAYPGFDDEMATQNFAGLAELDGEPGSEIICEMRKESPYQYIIRIISERTGRYRDYDFSGYGPGAYMVWLSQEGLANDLDGRPGCELLIKEASMEGGRMGVLSYRENRIHEYTVKYNSYWDVVKAVDTDGEPGAEVMIETDGPSQGDNSNRRLLILHERTGRFSQFQGLGPLGNGFQLLDSAELNGQAGDELVYVDIYAPEYTVMILSDNPHASRKYVIPNSTNFNIDFSMTADFDGQPGNELFMHMPFYDSRFAVIRFGDHRVFDYTPDPSWNYVGVYEFNGLPGNEIVFMDSQNLYYKAVCLVQGLIIQ